MPSAYNHALDALSRRSRSAAELSRWLRERDHEPAEVEGAIERLTAAGLLDDAKFAASFARSRLLDRKLSRRRVLAELGRRGITRELADAAVSAVFADEAVDEEAEVMKLGQKKLRGMPTLDRQTARRRLMAFLARRGHDGDVVRRVVARLTKS